MEIIGKGSGSDLITTLPKPPGFFDAASKRYYKEIGRVLITAKVLKRIHIKSLEMLATNCAQWEWSVKAISEKNKQLPGRGFMQLYSTGATNLSTELIIKRDAEKAMRDNLAAFGMDPQSEKKLAKDIDPAQGDLFAGFMAKKNG